MKEERNTIHADGNEIAVITRPDESDYISLTDIARHANPVEPKDVVKNWMRARSTIEFLGLWEKLHNPGFKGVEFDRKSAKTAGPSPIQILPLSSRRGYRPSSSSISYRTISG